MKWKIENLLVLLAALRPGFLQAIRQDLQGGTK